MECFETERCGWLDLTEFDNDDINNVVQNLRRPQDIYHPTVPALTGSAEVLANIQTDAFYLAAVNQRARVDAWTNKQAPLVCSALSVKTLKLVAMDGHSTKQHA